MDIEHTVLSEQILDSCLRTKPGQRVWINSWDHTLKLASDLAWESRKRSCEVLLTVQPEDLWLRSMIEAPLRLVTIWQLLLLPPLKRTTSTFTLLARERP